MICPGQFSTKNGLVFIIGGRNCLGIGEGANKMQPIVNSIEVVDLKGEKDTYEIEMTECGLSQHVAVGMAN